MLIWRLVILAALTATLVTSARGDTTCSNATACTPEKKSGGVPLELLAIIPGFGLMHGFAMMYCSRKRGDAHFKQWLVIGLLANVFGEAPQANKLRVKRLTPFPVFIVHRITRLTPSSPSSSLDLLSQNCTRQNSKRLRLHCAQGSSAAQLS